MQTYLRDKLLKKMCEREKELNGGIFNYLLF